MRKILVLNNLAQISHLKLDDGEEELLSSLEGMSPVGEGGQGPVRVGHAASEASYHSGKGKRVGLGFGIFVRGLTEVCRSDV